MKKIFLDELKKIKKQQEYFKNFQTNRERERREKRKEIRARNRTRVYNRTNNKIFPFGVDNVYLLENLHNKINWYKYYIELYIVEYFEQLRVIRENKRKSNERE